jgi:hypothetical protein
MTWSLPKEDAKRLEQLKAGVHFTHRTDREPLKDNDGQQRFGPDGVPLWSNVRTFTQAVIKSEVDGSLVWSAEVEADGNDGEKQAFDKVMSMIPADTTIPSHGDLLRENAELKSKLESKSNKRAPTGTGS